MKFNAWVSRWLRLRRRLDRQRLVQIDVPLPAREQPLRAQLLTVQQMVERAQALASTHVVGTGAQGDPLLERLRANQQELERTHGLLEDTLREAIAVTPAAEWLLDNRHVIEEQIQLARRHLPPKYSRSLPILKNAGRVGLPRVFDIAGWVVAHADARIDALVLGEVLSAYQAQAPLDLGELWAVPIMVRLALIENLRRIAIRVQRDAREQRIAKEWSERINAASEQGARAMVIVVAELARSHMEQSRTFVTELTRRLQGTDAEAAPVMAWLERSAAEAGISMETMLSEEVRKQAADQVSVANAIGSLRSLSAIDWRAFVEQHSSVEALLRADPHGTYPRMDFATRDGYRHVVERLARQSGVAENDVAELALTLAGAHAPQTMQAHVGWYLIDEGSDALRDALRERAAGKRVPIATRRLGLAAYLLPIAAIAIAGAWLTLRMWGSAPMTYFHGVWLALAALLVFSELGIVLVNWAATLVVAPKPLPRMDFEAGIPVSASTLVVVPTLVSSIEAVDALLSGLEVRYLGNRLGAVRFALLSDFADAEAREMPGDAALVEYAQQAVAALNARHAWAGDGDRFLLLHRPREWNPSEGRWMAHERKRGKLAALNRLIRVGDRSSFLLIAGNTDGIDQVRYVITLDTDTQLPRGAAAELAACMAHPLNQPVLDAGNNTVRRGYALLQPGLGSTMSGRGHSRFARLFGSESGIDPYTRTVSNVYQDLFGEGSFVGKGVYMVEAFEQVLADRFPDNRILSHDLLEGCYLHAGLVSDIRVYEDYPARYAADIKRRSRWIRGDWQLLPWLLPWVPLPNERWQRNPLSWLSLGKLTDNLRRSLVPIAAVLLLLAGWLSSAHPVACSVLVLALWFVPSFARAGLQTLRSSDEMPYEAHLADVLRALRRDVWQGVVNVACLAYEAGMHASAIARTLWRMAVSKRGLLEWDASHEVERRLGKAANPELRSMAASPVFAIAMGAVLVWLRPSVLPVALPVLALWAFAPALMAWLGRMPAGSREELDAPSLTFVQMLARRTWAFFEDYVTDEDHFLPPDNLQLEPDARIAHRTSPTNIGLSLLANLSAYDLGYAQVEDVLWRVERTLTTLERLERHRGHFFNWYDTRTLQPLPPRYVSTVDSGNLAGHLITLAQGLEELSSATGCHPRSREGLITTLDVLAMHLNDAHASRLVDDAKRGVERDLAAPETQAALSALEPIAAAAGEQAVRWLHRIQHQAQRAQLAENEAPLAQAQRRHRIETLVARVLECARMDFRFLYDQRKRLLHIGYNVDSHQLDGAYYDLLASEARLTTYLAVASAQLPQEAWFALGRTQTEVQGEGTLLSWSGSMFEYLMPDLVMPSYPDTLLASAVHNAVRAQIAYGDAHHVPWGISESGYHAFDAQLNYQYRAFGVPALALKRGLGKDLVIAPYACAMALMSAPRASARNLRRMQELGFSGEYGLYEAVDYTKERLPRGRDHVVLRSYMAHHQGMALLAMARVLAGPNMQRRFQADPELRSALLLLQERVPRIGIFHPNESTVDDVDVLPALRESPLRVYADPRQRAVVQLLSNGRMHAAYTAAGGASLRLGDTALTRWRDDPTTESWGQYLYLRDTDTNAWWSAAHLPSRARLERHEAIFSDAKVEYRTARRGIETHLEIVISPEEAAEVRRLHVVNRSRKPCLLEFTTYAEVALGKQSADEAHPAFANLFVRTEYIEAKQALLCTRRPRSQDESPPVLAHMIAVHGADLDSISYETDRARFLGRGRGADDPAALDPSTIQLGGTTGAVLDPIIAIRGRVLLQPDQSMVLDIVTGATEDQPQALALIDKYRDRGMADRAFELAWTHAQVVRRQLGMSEAESTLVARMAGLLLQPQAAHRGHPSVLRQNRSGQSALWPQAISGDLPILLLHMSSTDALPLAAAMVRAHAYLRAKGVASDLVIVNQNVSIYRQELQDEIRALLSMDPEAATLDRSGGIYIRAQDQLSQEERILLQAVARIVIDDRRGALDAQIARQAPPGLLPGPFESSIPAAETPPVIVGPEPGLPPPSQFSEDVWPFEHAPAHLQFENGIGGFAADGREYVTIVRPGAPTPMPWSNVLANASFGCVVTESGTGYTWHQNAHAYRLSTWHNDPVSDPQSEAIYIRDEDTGRTWSPTPLPRRGTGAYRTRHGFGYSVYEHVEDGIVSELWVFVEAERAVKHMLLRLRDLSGRPRVLSVWGYVEWVLGDTPSKNRMHVVTELDSTSGVLLARNAYHPEFGANVAFFDVDAVLDADGRRLRGVTGDRTEFIGKNGSLQAPAALRRIGLSGRTGVGMDPCGALQREVRLPAGGEADIGLRLGAAASAAEAIALAHSCRGLQAAQDALDEVRMHWNQVLSAVRVETPDPAVNLMLNGWLPYQIMASRVLARSGFYQSGGAYGFRDQLQDTMASVHAAPQLTREHLLRSAAHQFPEGDVMHWWHPPGDRGVRTRCSDDYLWLPQAVCRYIEVTGDAAVLEEHAPFVEGRAVRADEESYYDRPVVSSWSASLYDHCIRALERGMRLKGEHGLPLMGTGDWNDGMNKVGEHGRGESVWLAFFLHDTLQRFIPVAQARGQTEFAQTCAQYAHQLRQDIDRHAWDGAWYLRAWFDDGTPLGSSANEECRIDAISQAWSVLSGAGDPARARQAMAALDQYLVHRDSGLVQLLNPPFDHTLHDPGYIRGYVPGVRENGGQYTHSAVWAAMAFAQLQDGQRAWDIAHMINPIAHGASPEGVARYKVEPYVLAADVYGVAPHIGRGGWTWYTGSAGWMYRLLLESLLGVQRQGDRLIIKPLVPASWPEYRIQYRLGDTVHEIRVSADIVAKNGNSDVVVPLQRDGGHHLIDVPARSG